MLASGHAPSLECDFMWFRVWYWGADESFKLNSPTPSPHSPPCRARFGDIVWVTHSNKSSPPSPSTVYVYVWERELSSSLSLFPYPRNSSTYAFWFLCVGKPHLYGLQCTQFKCSVIAVHTVRRCSANSRFRLLCTYFYFCRHSLELGWASITNRLDLFADGGTPGSTVPSSSLDFHTALS